MTISKKLTFIALSLLLGLVPLAASEVVLRWADIGYVSDADDPFVSFVNVRPYFGRTNQQANMKHLASG